MGTQNDQFLLEKRDEPNGVQIIGPTPTGVTPRTGPACGSSDKENDANLRRLLSSQEFSTATSAAAPTPNNRRISLGSTGCPRDSDDVRRPDGAGASMCCNAARLQDWDARRSSSQTLLENSANNLFQSSSSCGGKRCRATASGVETDRCADREHEPVPLAAGALEEAAATEVAEAASPPSTWSWIGDGSKTARVSDAFITPKAARPVGATVAPGVGGRPTVVRLSSGELAAGLAGWGTEWANRHYQRHSTAGGSVSGGGGGECQGLHVPKERLLKGGVGGSGESQGGSCSVAHRINLSLSDGQKEQAIAAVAARGGDGRVRLSAAESGPKSAAVDVSSATAAPATATHARDNADVGAVFGEVVQVRCRADPDTDMFQMGRMQGPGNDFEVKGPLHQPTPRGKVCGPVSRHAVRFLVDRKRPHRCRIFTGGFNGR